jgi:hypothetical protein
VVSFDTGFSRNYNQYPYGTYDQLGDNSLLFPQSFIDSRRPMKELVLGITQGGTARAYPYGSLGERAAVNDMVGGRPVLVVFDRATEMAVAFDREVAGRPLSFEAVDATGFPFRLRDRETGTLWDLTGAALSGPHAGSRMSRVAAYSAMWSPGPPSTATRSFTSRRDSRRNCEVPNIRERRTGVLLGRYGADAGRVRDRAST